MKGPLDVRKKKDPAPAAWLFLELPHLNNTLQAWRGCSGGSGNEGLTHLPSHFCRRSPEVGTDQNLPVFGIYFKLGEILS